MKVVLKCGHMQPVSKGTLWMIYHSEKSYHRSLLVVCSYCFKDDHIGSRDIRECVINICH